MHSRRGGDLAGAPSDIRAGAPVGGLHANVASREGDGGAAWPRLAAVGANV